MLVILFEYFFHQPYLHGFHLKTIYSFKCNLELSKVTVSYKYTLMESVQLQY